MPFFSELDFMWASRFPMVPGLRMNYQRDGVCEMTLMKFVAIMLMVGTHSSKNTLLKSADGEILTVMSNLARIINSKTIDIL